MFREKREEMDRKGVFWSNGENTDSARLRHIAIIERLEGKDRQTLMKGFHRSIKRS